ncbi:MAG TPA: hypothetical protein VJ739_11785 [Gemmataceae bacterium]|nr:hypothetical protein [Gemmataceae bacterium]
MADDSKYRVRNPRLPSYLGEHAAPEVGAESDEETCPAFGFLRGQHERAVMLGFRLRNGNSEAFAYSCLVSFRHDPSVGLLLRFTGDGLTLVLVSGSNLDAPVGEGTVNLTDRGLQRHRVTFLREMDEDELQKAGEGVPTIDGIDIGEFETVQEMRDWLKERAPAFLRAPG